MQLFLDYDGVMVDFHKYAKQLLGVSCKEFQDEYGDQILWDTTSYLNPEFWLKLELLPDAMTLYDAVKHLYPIILTGAPKEMPSAIPQKKKSIKQYFGEWQMNNSIICRVSEKPKYCNPGDILIDDRLVSKKKWEKVGGIFILHTSAANSIQELEKLGVLKEKDVGHSLD